jgi:hypothetical protein
MDDFADSTRDKDAHKRQETGKRSPHCVACHQSQFLSSAFGRSHHTRNASQKRTNGFLSACEREDREIVRPGVCSAQNRSNSTRLGPACATAMTSMWTVTGERGSAQHTHPLGCLLSSGRRGRSGHSKFQVRPSEALAALSSRTRLRMSTAVAGSFHSSPSTTMATRSPVIHQAMFAVPQVRHMTT